MNKWTRVRAVFPQRCYRMSLNDADTMAGPDVQLAPGGDLWFIIHFVLTAPLLSLSRSRLCQKSRQGWNWSPVKESPAGGSMGRCGAPGAADPVSGWSMDRAHQPLKSQCFTAEQFHIGRHKQMLPGNCIESTVWTFLKIDLPKTNSDSVIVDPIHSLNISFLCSIHL